MMKDKEYRYEHIASFNQESKVYYAKFGSYQGTWLLITYKNNKFKIYKDYYGSCSGCDAIQSKINGFNPPNNIKELARKFFSQYQPFLQIPIEIMRELNFEDFMMFMPKNRYDYSMSGTTWLEIYTRIQNYINKRKTNE